MVLTGPTADNPVWGSVTTRRDRGSPIWQPVYDNGVAVRFAHRATNLESPAAPWRTSRVVYLENGSDPVTWWTPDLIWDPPGWLNSPRAPDVSSDMEWFPLVTFWQVTCDLAAADSVPEGFGHRFGTLPVAAWAAVAEPGGWTAADSGRLEQLLEAEALGGEL